KNVSAVAADQDVITIAAVGDERHGGAEPFGGDDVGARETVDDNAIGCLEASDRHRGRKTGYGNDAVLINDGDNVVAAGRRDGNRIDRSIAGGTPERRGEVDLDLRHISSGHIVDNDIIDAAKGIEFDGL